MHTAVQISSMQSHVYIDSMISFFGEKCSFFSCDLYMRSTWLYKQKLINKITFSIGTSIVVVQPTASLLKQNNYDLTTHVATLQTANIINSIPYLNWASKLKFILIPIQLHQSSNAWEYTVYRSLKSDIKYFTYIIYYSKIPTFWTSWGKGNQIKLTAVKINQIPINTI